MRDAVKFAIEWLAVRVMVLAMCGAAGLVFLVLLPAALILVVAEAIDDGQKRERWERELERLAYERRNWSYESRVL